MSVPLQNAIFFSGGKRIQPISGKGLIFSKLADGSGWSVNLDLVIPKAEADQIIRKFTDFPNQDPTTFATNYPNQVYFPAFDAAGNSIDVGINMVKLFVFYDKDDAGGIQFSISPSATGKTQNEKTQNAFIGHTAP